ncbi:MAG: universal stress protein [Desulfarculaceae bacterium]|nr:universal stress protein [Desulfarculaceae bacterium]MCF8070864.1 universal stress protein [Desulfarculaceae bacterium]MCF8100452.1 universal stress protein [Desulfarculaceae bacterium]MCF8117962.1 universal stress protein [Desulfarculaceae bacterium]
MTTYRRIVCCLDFSPQAETAFGTALELAQGDQAELILLHVVHAGAPQLPGEKPGAARRLSREELRDRLHQEMEARYLQKTGGYPAKVRLRRGLPSVEILDELAQSGAGLVVMGAEGLSGVGLFLLGSVAERVSRRSPCSCLVVRRPAPA